jgi:hypothetical protein
MIGAAAGSVNAPGCGRIDADLTQTPLSASAVVVYSVNVAFMENDAKGDPMFAELTEELLDLEVTDRGYGGALYAATDPGGSCCGGCCNLVLCCCCSQICW